MTAPKRYAYGDRCRRCSDIMRAPSDPSHARLVSTEALEAGYCRLCWATVFAALRLEPDDPTRIELLKKVDP